MKKTFLISIIFSFGLLISSCNGMFGDLLGTSNTKTGTGSAADSAGSGDTLRCPRHSGHHRGSDHDADDSTAVNDTAARNHIILRSH